MDIVVTDFTKFHNKDIVCIAGLNPSSIECIRPMPYITCSSCLKYDVVPGVVLTGYFDKRSAIAPHCEDRNCKNLTKSGFYSIGQFHDLLKKSLSPSLESGFGVCIDNGQKHFDCQNVPEKSIITIEVSSYDLEIIEDQFNPGRIKGIFSDKQNREYRFISITDFCYCEYAEKKLGDHNSVRALNSFLGVQEKIFLRIGLTRQYKSPDGRDGYWIQINGIYSFPGIFPEIRNCFSDEQQ
jgi:hypothetical protein